MARNRNGDASRLSWTAALLADCLCLSTAALAQTHVLRRLTGMAAALGLAAGLAMVSSLGSGAIVAAAPAVSATPGGTMSFTTVMLPRVGFAYAINNDGWVLFRDPSDPFNATLLWTPEGSITEVGGMCLSGGAFIGTPHAISDGGWVTGARCFAPTDDAAHQHAYVREPDGDIIDLDTFGENGSYGYAVNDHGWVTGEKATTSYSYGFVWTPESGLADLGTLGGRWSWGDAINNQGWIIGGSETADGYRHAFVWRPEAGMTDLGTLGGTVTETFFGGINDDGWIVGNSTTTEGQWHGFLWKAVGGMTDLGTLGGNQSGAAAINDNGWVAGSSATADGEVHGVVWTSDGRMIDLGTLGGNESHASAINDNGWAAGWSTTAEGHQHGVVWTPDGGMIDLGTLGGTQSSASAINDNGWVVGYSTTGDGQPHAVVWVPVGVPPRFTGTASNVAVGTDLGVCSARVSFVLPAATGQPVPTVTAAPPAGSTFPLGDTTVTVTAGNGIAPDAVQTFTVTVTDAAGPLVAGTPANVVVDATGPTGVPVTYATPTVTDNCPGVRLIVTGPPSGAIFPIGDTTVRFSATDAAGTTTTSSFIVHVRGSAEQLAGLVQLAVGVGPGTSLYNKVVDIQGLLAGGNLIDACGKLGAFIQEVEAKAGKPNGISTAQAAELVAAAARIRAVLGC